MTPGSADEDKAALRRHFLARRRALSDAQIAAARQGVREAVLRRCRERGWRCVAAYEPLRTEPGSTALLDGLAAAGVEVIVPVLLPDRDLDWSRWRDTPGGPLGTAAIARADAVLVPALAVAHDGTRLGRGGGSYDRVLPRVPAGVPVAALLHAGELVASLPWQPWDVRVGAVVLPDGWHPLQPPRVDGE